VEEQEENQEWVEEEADKGEMSASRRALSDLRGAKDEQTGIYSILGARLTKKYAL